MNASRNREGLRFNPSLCDRSVRWLFAATAGLVCIGALSPPTVGDDGQDRLGKFLGSYCIDCHSQQESEGNREFESLRLPLESEPHLIAAAEIVDQLTLRQMPPPDAQQPSNEERLAMLEFLRSKIQEGRSRLRSTGGRTVMRRLTNREYEITLATLLSRQVDTLGLTTEFASDNPSRNIDRIGSEMITSGELLDQYFSAANRLIELRLNKPDMEPKEWHFQGNFVQYEELSGPHKSVFNYRYLCLYEQPNTDTRQGGYGHIEDFLQGVPVSGLYDIEVHARAMHRDTHYDPKIFRIDFSEPFQLAVVPGDVKRGHIHYPQSIEPILGQAVVPDDEAEWLTFRVWLEEGQTPRFIFPNGPYESRASVLESNKKYKEELKVDKDPGVNRAKLLTDGALPHIRIDEIKIRGPLPEPKGIAEELSVFGPTGFQPEQALEQLAAFAERAFRRPLHDSDRQRIERIYRKRIEQNVSPKQAALDAVKMILCSPSFLYLCEQTPEESTTLGGYDLASRLSYAVWGAPPDQELLAAAASEQLLDASILKQQVLRMLADPRSDEFVRRFLDSWLNLRVIGSLPPPRQTASEYYSEDLPTSMKEEAKYFFRHLLDTNGPVSDFIDSDYTFVDKKLAKLYGLPEKETLRLADGFQRVSLADRGRRGGVLGMAGVLTASANGVDTSPVTRGVWVLENLLGTPPPPPPDVVPAIEADVSGATTIRERLEKHRADSACNVCHRKIDPMGFALEHFDPIGRYRDKYAKPKGGKTAPKVDPSGRFPSGETYASFSEFKQLLRSTRSSFVVRHMVETMLSYSTGRHMEPGDKAEIESIVERIHEDNLGLRTMVVEVLASEIFRSR
ncbi:DUF1592 domain-containing protein [Pirellulaceae bacterium SH501]